MRSAHRSPSSRRRRASVEPLEPRLLLTTYYVAPGGSDYNDGTSRSDPLATIQDGEFQVQAGDTVIVEPGTYAGFDMGYISSPVSGTPTQPITFEADPSAPAGSVIINSRELDTENGIDLEAGDNYVVIKGFTIINSDSSITRAGINVGGCSYVSLLDNTISGCGLWGILGGFDDHLLVQGNNVSGSIGQHGIYVGDSSTNISIIGNTCYNNRLAGIQLNGDLNDGNPGIIVNALIADNTIYGNGYGGGSAINCDGVTNSVIENNLLYDNHQGGISLFQYDGATGSTNNVVVNNTVDMASDGGWALNINTDSTGNVVFDNVFMNDNPDNIGDISIDDSSLPGLVSDHNILMGLESLDGGDTYTDIGTWRSTTGQDAHSIVLAPGATFMNEAGNNYQLKSNSGGITMGVASFGGSAAPLTDIYGNSRTATGNWEIGAFQAQIAIAVTAPIVVIVASPTPTPDTTTDSSASAPIPTAPPPTTPITVTLTSPPGAPTPISMAPAPTPHCSNPPGTAAPVTPAPSIAPPVFAPMWPQQHQPCVQIWNCSNQSGHAHRCNDGN
jgi:parallel beta-helix repeat protein